MSWGHARVTGVWRMCFEDKKRLTNNPLLVLSFTTTGAPLPVRPFQRTDDAQATEAEHKRWARQVLDIISGTGLAMPSGHTARIGSKSASCAASSVVNSF